MRTVLLVLRLLAALGLLLPASTPARGGDEQRVPASWSGAEPACADVAGEGRLALWADRPPASSESSSSGHDAPAAAFARRGADSKRWRSCAVRGAFAPGERSLAQAFLRVNGSADAHGARA